MMLSLIQSICPSCKTPRINIFYQAKNIPINSSQLFSTQKEALDFPRGDLALGLCEACGFIFNVAFDPLKVDYASLAPEEQGFSKTFNAYAQDLASRLIETYDLRNKHISEIGCGRGDFLALLCELGKNSGVGIDPSIVSGGVQSKAADQLMFIRDYFSERYAEYLGDFVCCRHTLEHISDTSNFINSLRKSIGTKETPVFFEVPDVDRILQEVAFWDIYYEHCSYFSLDSLSRLFGFCNFKVLSSEKTYFNQYLVIEAKPIDKQANVIVDRKESLDSIIKMVNDFSNKCSKKLEFWEQELKRIRAERKKAIIWGSGSKCVAFMTTLQIKDEIQFIVDINPNRNGKFIPLIGKQIFTPDVLKDNKPDTIIVMNPVYCDEIRKTAESMGVKAEYLLCK